MNDTDFVLDCSATVPWGFGDEITPATSQLLCEMRDGATAWVPALWHLEVGNVLLNALRNGRVTQTEMDEFICSLKIFRINTDNDTDAQAWERTLDLAQWHDLSLYDAAYLELALRMRLPLATLDKALRKVAKKTGVILKI